MKVLITGKSGFLGKELTGGLKSRYYEVTSIGREEVDLTSSKSVAGYFKGKQFDVLIHTAFQGGKRGQEDTLETLINNLAMFNNLAKQSKNYYKLINFCSGASFDRYRDIYDFNEERYLDCFPSDYYGMSKNIIARECKKLDNVFNLRVFGCFGVHENETRFIKSSICKALQNKPIIIHQNKMMDFISTQDITSVVDFYMTNYIEDHFRDINLCYPEKMTLKRIALKIIDLTNSKSQIIIEKHGFSPTYTGSNKKFEQLNISLDGLDRGLIDLVNKIDG